MSVMIKLYGIKCLAYWEIKMKMKDPRWDGAVEKVQSKLKSEESEQEKPYRHTHTQKENTHHH